MIYELLTMTVLNFSFALSNLEHRGCFVGKNTKSSHADAWKDMPATANIQVAHNSTSNFFRERAVANKE